MWKIEDHFQRYRKIERYVKREREREEEGENGLRER